MHKYSQLTNSQNILIEIDRGGPVTSETIMALLGLAESTASNYLRKLYGATLLKRKNTRMHKKMGGPRYLYNLAIKGKKRVIWIKSNFNIPA